MCDDLDFDYDPVTMRIQDVIEEIWTILRIFLITQEVVDELLWNFLKGGMFHFCIGSNVRLVRDQIYIYKFTNYRHFL